MTSPTWIVSPAGFALTEEWEKAESNLELAKEKGLVPDYISPLDIAILYADNLTLGGPAFTQTEIQEGLEEEGIEAPTQLLKERLILLEKKGLITRVAEPTPPDFTGTLLIPLKEHSGSLKPVNTGSQVIFPLDPKEGPLTLAHELGHLERWKQGLSVEKSHEATAHAREEELVWKLAAKSLRRSNNWTTENRIIAAEYLATYYKGDNEEEKLQQALDFMNRI